MEPLVTIVLPDLAGPAALDATLASLTRHTPEPYAVCLLVEAVGPASALLAAGHGRPATALAPLVAPATSLVPAVPVLSASSTPGGPISYQSLTVPAPCNLPAALNLLLGVCITPFLLVLESGAIVTGGWLTRLLEPLKQPGIGLSGPSTNLSWNEQRVFSEPGGFGWSIAKIEAYAANIAARYAQRQRALSELHSLGDFCYLFKREVAQQLGGFEQAYGAGPCWEIDFNTRAARAGFSAVWVADAYVHRAPAPSARASISRRLFNVNKQLYQDRFCGLRLRGEKQSYEPHCRGEACEHFAPRDLIQVVLQSRLQLASQVEEPTSAGAGLASTKASAPPVPQTAPTVFTASQERSPASQSIPSANQRPLVSCIMPTRDRRAFVAQALLYFERQTYPERELIVIDDGEEKIADLLSAHPYVRYLALPRPLSIGEKRNLACEQARGEIIAHWDDDDWYAPHRLQHQVAPLLDKSAEIDGLETACFFDLTSWQAWTCTPELHRRLFVGDVHGGTLVYWRWVWEKLAHYPPRSVAEDALFLRQATQRGARLRKLEHAASFVYLRHQQNAWKFSAGSYLSLTGWRRCEISSFLPAADLPFYQLLSSPALTTRPQPPQQAAASSGLVSPGGVSLAGSSTGGISAQSLNLPLVSCIMPTYNRRHYVPQAIQYFLRQDYPQRELLILDDGSEDLADLIPAHPQIRYLRLPARLVLGAKRNLACQLAQGSLIAHWDDDDWMAPQRLRSQVEQLERTQADLCGAGRQLYYSPATDQAWLYEYPATIRHWIAGNTLCYRKAFWEKHPFPEIAIGEDTHFVWSPQARNTVIMPDHTFYVGLVHAANTSRKHVQGPYWHPHPVEEVHRLLGDDLPFYNVSSKRHALETHHS